MASLHPAILKQSFGSTADGREVDLFTLSNAAGSTAKVTTYGATLTELNVPDRNGHFSSVVLGFDNLQQYIDSHSYIGATIGPYANRVAGASFILEDIHYSLQANDGGNCLHSGESGFHRQIWQASPEQTSQGQAVKLSLLRKDGVGGFPGNLKVDLTYTLNDDNQLIVEYEAVCDQATPVNLTHHSYFNLAGAGSGNILNHQLLINADCITPVDQSLLPSGEILPVDDTAFDFRHFAFVGDKISAISGGYDHNFVINHDKDTAAAIVKETNCGRVMTVWTSEPGLQFYSGNFLDGSICGIGGAYSRYGAFCLEAQKFPDSLHHKNFPDPILRPGASYKQRTIYQLECQ